MQNKFLFVENSRNRMGKLENNCSLHKRLNESGVCAGSSH